MLPHAGLPILEPQEILGRCHCTKSDTYTPFIKVFSLLVKAMLVKARCIKELAQIRGGTVLDLLFANRDRWAGVRCGGWMPLGAQ